MKKTLTFILLFSLLFLSSCKDQTSDVIYFVHAAGIENKNNNVKLTLLLEKHNEKDYFTASQTEETLHKAVKNLMSEHKECYFATNDIYLIRTSENKQFLSDIAKELCDSNVFPTTSEIISLEDVDIEGFMKKLNNTDKLKKLRKNSIKGRVNIINFFSHYTSAKEVSLNTFTLKDGKITKTKQTTFTYNQKRRNK